MVPLTTASTKGCSAYLVYGLYFFKDSKPIFVPILLKSFSDVFLLNLTKISMSAFSGNHVFFAYEPPRAKPTI